MESDVRELFQSGHERGLGTNPEVEDVYERINALSTASRAQFMQMLIEILTKDEMANILDKVAIKLHDPRE